MRLWDPGWRGKNRDGLNANGSSPRGRRGGDYRLTTAEGLERRIVLSSYPLHFDDSFLPYPSGATPFGVTADAAGDVFGVLTAGGPKGPPTIFEIAHGSSTVTPLATFSSADGSGISSLVVDPSGDLFGTTSNGTYSVFELQHGSGSITTLASFDNATGYYPDLRMALDPSGDLFGTTFSGGTGGSGTVFELPHGSSTLSVLASFNGTNGEDPQDVVVDANGNVFGTVTYMVISGVSNEGGVFEVAKGSGTVTTIATFNGSDGEHPQGGVAFDSKGDLFGTAAAGGADEEGDVFEVPHGTNTIDQIAPFNGTNGADPTGDVVVDAAGDVFGTSEAGGSSFGGGGTVFEVVSGSAAATALGSFGASNGSYPDGIGMDSAGDLFGAATAGGPSASDDGVVYEATHGATTLTTLEAFGSVNGSSPQGVVADTAGDLFGTTADSGPNASGTIFEVSHTTGVLTTLASFTTDNGENPLYLYNTYYGSYPAVTLDSAGDVFGVANTGGTTGAGTIFEVAHNTSTVTTLASFNGTNGQAPVSLVLDASGNIFGISTYGGANDYYGTVFELPHGSSTITALVSFSSATGSGQAGGIFLDASDDLFGADGSGTNGVVFEVARGSGAITPVASFNGTNGSGPQGVTADAAGDLYGTTSGGGTMSSGTVFEVAHGTGAITSLASFDGVNEQGPEGAVSIDASGDVFGDTSGGGADGDGTVFEVAHNSGAVTQLLSFSGGNGQSPTFGVVSDGNNDLFGVTGEGGSAGAGAAFELSPVTATELVFTGEPANTVTGATLTPPLTIDLEDSSGNLATTNNSTVTLAIKSGPAGAKLGGTATAVAANGIATFSNLSFATPGAYTLIATDGTLASATSISFTVAGTPAAVVINGGNGQSATAGTAFPTPLTVEVTDSLGDPVPGVAVTFAAPDGTPGASGTFAGTSGDGTSISVQTNASGIASAPILICNTVAGSFNVKAADGSISANFALTNTPGPSAQLAIGEQPTVSGTSLPTVTVDVQDSYGNLVTTDTSTVVLAITSGPSGAKLQGGTSVAAVGGVATFANLVLSPPGAYVLTATDGALTSVPLAMITIVPAPPTVVSVTPEDDAGNGVAAGSAAKGQRSMETQIAVVFSAPVNLATGAFALGLVNNYGSGTNNGAANTSLAGILGTPTNPSGNGETWIIPILSNGTNSYALKATHGGISGASLDNGVYQLNVIASDVTAATGGTAMAANYTSAAWHRLYGDVDNARRVFNTEYSAFLAAFTSTYASNGATNYNQDLDYDGDGRVFNTDYSAFLANFGSTKIYTEPQS